MSECLKQTSVVACHDNAGVPTPAVIHYTFDDQGAPAVRITDAGGAVIATATVANTTPGACVSYPPDVELEQLCDIDAAGVATPFIRRTITVFSPTGAPTTTSADFALDNVTPYAPAGTVGVCPSCPALTARGLQAAW